MWLFLSLTFLIDKNSEVKNFFKSVIPKKAEFKTVSGHIPFSKEYTEYAIYKLDNMSNSGLIGTAFDYIARWLVAQKVNFLKENSYTNLVAEAGMNKSKIVANRMGLDIEEVYNEGIQCCKQFVNGEHNKSKLIETAILFAKFEIIYRAIPRPFIQQELEKLSWIEEEIYEDLENLFDVFKTNMIESGLVNEDSSVVYNPTFGDVSRLCGGADADIYIDGILYDFKCTRQCGYRWTDISQIFGYFLLANIAKKNNDPDNKLKSHEIDKIALYRARYGEIEYYSTNNLDFSKIVNQFEEILKNISYR